MKINPQVLLDQAAEAEAAGFVAAAAELKTKAERARKLAIAYEHYRYVPEEQFKAFNDKLKQKTERPATDADEAAYNITGYRTSTIHDKLVIVALGTYAGLPPADVLQKTKLAKERGCFDSFEVAEVKPVATHVKLPDPIVFGRIEGCTDRFFVAEWGSDVSINDLLQKNEG